MLRQGAGRGRPSIRTELGLHPPVAYERGNELPLFEPLLPSIGYVGEVELDGSRGVKAHDATQRKAFETILTMWGRAGRRVLSIHNRSAVDEVLDCLRIRADAGTPILRSFSGFAAEAFLRELDRRFESALFRRGPDRRPPQDL